MGLTASHDARALAHRRNAIITAFGLGGVTAATWGPRLPAIASELRVGTATIGLVVACSTVGSVCGLVLSTPLLGRFGPRHGVRIAALVVASALGLMGGAIAIRSVPLVAAAFTVMGLGIGTLDVLINVEGAAVERLAGRSLLPLMHSAWSGGAALGSGIGAACAAAGVSPAAQFLGVAAVVAVVGLVLSASIPLAAPPPQDRPSRAQRVRQWLRGWTDRRLLLIGVVMLGVEFGEGSANNWLSLAVRDNHHQSGAIAALFYTVFAISEASTRAFGGPVVDRLGRVRTIRLTVAAGIVGTVLFIVAGNAWLVLVGVVLWAVGVSMGFPLGMSAAAEGGAGGAARVSVVASLGYFSNLVGPPLLGVLAQSLGLLSALWLIAVLLIASFAGSGALRPTQAGHGADSTAIAAL